MSIDRETTFTYLGHATILIETPGGKRILIDPWTMSNPACPPEWKSPEYLGRLDLILLTHIHNDHADDAAAIIHANPDAEVVAIPEACGWLASKGAVNLRPMNKGGSQTCAGITITMTEALHSSSYRESDGTIVYGGEPAGYVLVLENGFTVYDAGDTALFGDMALIRDLYHPDIAIIPIGDLYTMGPREAAYAVRLLQVAHVIPVHYATFPVLTGTPEALARETADIDGLTIHALKPGEAVR